MQYDPTAVVGRRFGALAIDTVIGFIISGVLFFLLSESETVPYSGVCDDLREAEAFNICFQAGDTVRYAIDGRFWAFTLIGLAISAAQYVILQGITGASIGKHLVGLRVVDEQGQIAGIPKALIRYVVMIVDVAPFCFPIVGLVTVLASTGHRRVGDMVAKTYVVGKDDLGRPPVGGPGLDPRYGQSPAAYFGQPASGQPYPGQPYPGQGQPPTGQPWGQQPPSSGGGWNPPPPPPGS